jgi:hypothetical protein
VDEMKWKADDDYDGFFTIMVDGGGQPQFA